MRNVHVAHSYNISPVYDHCEAIVPDFVYQHIGHLYCIVHSLYSIGFDLSIVAILYIV